MLDAISNYILGGKVAQWKKVTQLQVGMKIATADTSNGVLSLSKDSSLKFDEIVSIKKVGRERVYDIEVEGTHNFVANGILAHNTYISGNLGIGNASPTTALHVGTNAESRTLDTGDVLVSSDLELDGILYLDGRTIANPSGTASIILPSDPTTTAATLTASNWLVENTANVGQAALMVNQTKAGDLFTASASGTPRFTITNAGNVGIGTTGPGSKLDVTTAGLAATQTTSSGLALVNTTAATALAPVQISPAIRWSGFGWKTDVTAASQAVDFRSYVVPVQGTANPTGYLSFGSSVNGAAYSDGQLVLTTAGSVGIGTTGPSYKLDVSGNIRASTAGGGGNPARLIFESTTTNATRWNWEVGNDNTKAILADLTGSTQNVSVSTAGVMNVRGAVNANTTPDIAEGIVTSDPSINAGDIVAPDPSAKTQIVKTQNPYQSNTIGIISTSPGINLHAGLDANLEPNDPTLRPLTLAGRIPVKISSLNGPIVNGDPITSSSLPGLGMKAVKAGQIVGKALESFSDFSPERCPAVSSLDAIQWPDDDGYNPAKPCFLLPNGVYVGKIIALVNLSWYDPDVYLTDSGDLYLVGNDQFPISNFQSNSNDSIFNLVNQKTGEIVTRIGAFAEVVAANIRAGAIESERLATNTLEAATATVDNMLITNGLVSPIIQTAIISPLPDEDLAIQLIQDSRFKIQDSEQNEVASIDTAGNATFSGSVNSEQLTVNGEATVSGTLYASSLVTDNGSPVTRSEIEDLLRKVETDQALLAQASSWNTNTATDSAVISDQWTVNSLYVTEQAAISSLSVSNSFAVGSDFVIQSLITDHQSPITSINTLSAPLALQSLALAPVEIMAGKVRIDTNGDVVIEGNLFIAGNLEVEGQAKFKEISAEKLIIAAGESNATSSAEIAAGEITTNATAGKAVISAGVSEITIRNPKITDYTLVYITPTSTTQNNVLYVKSKGAGFFTVGFSQPLEIDVTFNWWVIEVRSTENNPTP